MNRARLQALQAQLLARARQPVPGDWLPVVIGGAEVGVAGPEVAGFLAAHAPRFMRLDDRLVLDDADLDFAARTALLFEAASKLRDAGLLRGWRDEPLDVRPAPEAEPIATLERSACRPLGITTRAVHLNALSADGRMFVARRAAHKQIDPGRWDNLAGGMVPAGEGDLEALAREAYEEAGLDLTPLTLRRGGRFHVRRVVPEGFQSEIVQVFDTVLPEHAQPRNVDGEVAAIEQRDLDGVVAAIERGEFTLESALVALDALVRRG